MPKVQIKKGNPQLDMTAMCDVAFLLLSFFMLTTKFKPDEPVIVDTPTSVSEIKLPETDILMITIGKDGGVFFGIDGQPARANMLKLMGERYKIDFTPEELGTFSLVQNFGIPISQMKQYLTLSADERNKSGVQKGIPCDTVKNELADWVICARLSNPKFRIAVKGDRDANYPVIKEVIATLQEKNVNKFNLITGMEVASK